MLAVILAGGLGTRLYPLTRTLPKVLVPVLGRPFLEYQIELLTSCGQTNIVISTGHLGRMIEDHIGDGSPFGVTVRYSREREPLGTAGALRNAADLLDTRFLLLNGDTYLPIDYAVLADTAAKSKRTAVMVVSAGSPFVRKNARLTKSGLVAVYDKSNSRGMTHVDAGTAVLTRRAIEGGPQRHAISLEEDIYPVLANRGELEAYRTGLPFFDMGTLPGLRALEEHLKRNQIGHRYLE